MTAEPSDEQYRRVRVWFGSHPVADYIAELSLADRYAAAMRRRFAGLRVTSEPLARSNSMKTGVGPSTLPSEQLWELAP